MRLTTTAAVLFALSARLAAAQAAPSVDAARAAELFRGEKWQEAVAAYGRLVAQSPGDGVAQLRLGIALHSLARYADAIPHLQAAETLRTNAPMPSVRLARAFVRLGRGGDALAALGRAADAGFTSVATLDGDDELAPLRALPGFAAVRDAVDHNARPCAFDAAYRALDFWIGEWEVIGSSAAPGTPPSHSHIEGVEAGCVVYEQFKGPAGAGYSGRSFNSYDPGAKKWQQVWVDSAGGTHRYVGEARGGNVYYEAEGVHLPGQAAPARVRMTFFDGHDGTVRQLGEASTDGGATWSTQYDLTYRHPAAARP